MNPSAPKTLQIEDDRTGLSTETMRRAMADNLFYLQGKYPAIATPNDFYMALAYTVRDRLLHRWLRTLEIYLKKDVRVVAYLSAEFLMGPQLLNNLINMGIEDHVRKAVTESGLNCDELIAQEEEPGLGNGGLGRLAACYMDSLATLEIPAVGYGIRYEFGIFDQQIQDGWQREISDQWLKLGNPWEIRRPEVSMSVKLGGHTESYRGEQGSYRVRWIPERVVNGIPHDTPIPGYLNNTANTLRLWKAEAAHDFDLRAFNSGDYVGAVTDKMFSENISKVLYPNDDSFQGKQLRLEQQYFLVSCSLQDIIRLHLREGEKVDTLHEKFALQLNDTHPSVGIAELMRLLIDDYLLDWDKAWDITRQTFGYTNHTLLPEALERWPIALFGELLPRHLEIIYEINRRFLESVERKFPGDDDRKRRMSIIDEAGERYVRMAHLACIGSHSINGVAALHTELLEHSVLRDFFEMYPEKFSNKTNGITPRRWLVLSNPELTTLISSHISCDWIKDLFELKKLEPCVNDKNFCKRWYQIKQNNKRALAQYILENTGITVDPQSLFSVQVKRMHEYKRQLLNLLGIIHLYNSMRHNPKGKYTPCTFIFGGKAAPGYFMAKLIIKLINSVAEVINNDPAIKGLIKVVFLPDFNVRLGQIIYPAADLSEQISTAGKEASGTGNMKFSLNGALTIGTLDGANIEIRQEVGADNFFLFGLTAEEVQAKKASSYSPRDYYNANPALKEVIDLISSGYFSPQQSDLFHPITDELLNRDEYMLLADFQAYVDCRQGAIEAYNDRDAWTAMSILNVARMGKFSSDRAIREYCRDIWKAVPVPIAAEDYSQAKAVLRV